MIPQKGQYVKVYFRNETQLEGIIESWSNSQAILITEEGGSACIIMNVLEDVMLIKIIHSEENIKEVGLLEQEKLVEQEKYFNELEEEFEEVKEMPSEDNLRLKKLSELKDLMNKQERKIISDKLKDHTFTETQQVKYGYPDFFKK